jgi:uncharacterized protein YndB with AHSA1/START domain
MAAIRQQINIAVPLRSVWNTLVTAEGWRSFWADEARLEPRSGGRIVLVSQAPDGSRVEERGIFHEMRPTRKVEIAWDSTSPAPTRGTRVNFTLSRDGNETRLLLVHSGGGVLEDEEARSHLEREWKDALRTMRETLESAEPRPEN